MRQLIKLLGRSGLSSFTKEMLTNYKQIGAVVPSSKSLARAMAAEIPLNTAGLIIELGPGTGVVTQAILESGIPPQKLIIIERSPKFVQILKKRFPQLTILHGDAVTLSELLKPFNQPVDCVISSLPLRSLPQVIVAQISEELEKILHPHSTFVQYTYSFKNDPGHQVRELRKVKSQRIWLNIPPARIDTFRFL
ncbi:MAG: methyltransferase domain-containing protein [Legionellales bacterium]|nr:methyltransferase domain-containing protein [Legionellales bacterium]